MDAACDMKIPVGYWVQQVKANGETAFSAEISEAKAFTAASSRRNGRAARENRHARCDA